MKLLDTRLGHLYDPIHLRLRECKIALDYSESSRPAWIRRPLVKGRPRSYRGKPTMRWKSLRRSPSQKRKPYRLLFEEFEKRVLLATIPFGSAGYAVKETDGRATLDVPVVAASASVPATSAAVLPHAVVPPGTSQLAPLGSSHGGGGGGGGGGESGSGGGGGGGGGGNGSGYCDPPDSMNLIVVFAGGSWIEGQEGTQVVANFTDTGTDGCVGQDTLDPLTDFTATIDWGDGTTSAGTIVAENTPPDSPPVYDVLGTHTFDEEGYYPMSVTVADAGDESSSVGPYDIGPGANVTDAPISVSLTPLAPNEGQTVPVNGNPLLGTYIAAITDSDPIDPSVVYTYSIDWGDGTPNTTGSTHSLYIHATHKWMDEGDYVVTIFVLDDGGSGASALEHVHVKDAPLTAQGLSLTMVEGNFAGTVATFIDADHSDPDDPSQFTATIDWGDGSGLDTTAIVGAGTVTGSHAYDDGTWTATVTIYDDGGQVATATSTFIITDAPLTAQATPPAPAEGDGDMWPVATFTDGHAGDPADSYSVSVAWSAGTGGGGQPMLVGSGGSFTVYDYRFFKDDGVGTALVTVTIDDADIGIPGSSGSDASVTVTGQFTVREKALDVWGSGGSSDPGPHPGGSLSGVEGQQVSGILASVSGSGGDPLTASVNWGDGASETVPVIGGQVRGSHTYAEEGVYRLTVVVWDLLTETVTTYVGKATIADLPFTASGAPDLSAVQCVSLDNATVATFHDDHPDDALTNYHVTVDWGDGTGPLVDQNIVGSNGDYTVLDSHTYAHPGTYLIHTRIQDEESPFQDVYTTIVVQPTDPPSAGLVTDSHPQFTNEGDTLSGLLATFHDSLDLPADDYTATIDWGDRTPTSYGVVSGGSGTYQVSGQHVYTDDGSFLVAVSLRDSSRSVLSFTTVVVQDFVPQLSVRSLSVPRGAALTAIDVAQFEGYGPLDQATDYYALIDWGDGRRDAGGVVGSGGHFHVVGSHTYGSTGSYTMGVTVMEPNGSVATASGSVSVADLAEGAPWSADGPLVMFSDENPYATDPGLYVVTIDWGDGGPGHPDVSAGTVEGSNPFDVPSPTHTFTEPCNCRIVTTVQEGDGDVSGSDSRTVSVADAPLQKVEPADLTGVPDQPLSGATVAVFQDLDPGGTVTDYSATIDWGDGIVSTGTVTANDDGSFRVAGDHTYAQAGFYTVVVYVADQDGSTLVVQGIAGIYSWSATAAVRRNDPDRADLTAASDATVTANTGGVRLSNALDFDLSPGTIVGGNPALVYNSNTAAPHPIVEVTLQDPETEPTPIVPVAITAQLTWEGRQQSLHAYTVTQPSADGTYVVQVPLDDTVEGSGIYDYRVDLTLTFDDGSATTTTATGQAGIVAQDNSPDGAGWSLAGWSRLVFQPTGDVLRAYGTGDSRVFTSSGNGTFQSPPEDFGTLQRNDPTCACGGYTYTDTHQERWLYNEDGQLTAIVDPHDLLTTYSYDGPLLTEVDTPDGASTTLSYDNGPNYLLEQIDEPGGRTVLTGHGGEDLTTFTDADGSPRTFTYSDHRLVEDLWRPRDVRYTYDPNGVLTEVNRGGGWILSVTPASAVGILAGNVALATAPQARLIDGLGNPTASTLDLDGRVLERDRADDTVETWDRNDHGDAMVYQDPLGWLTSYYYDNAGDVTSLLQPDGTTPWFTYDAQFHRLLQSADGNGNVTTYTLNATGDTTSKTDPLGNTTVYTWANGLLLSTTDPLGNTTTYSYDGNRRLVQTTTPRGGPTRLSYDGNGDPARSTDADGFLTQTLYDNDNRLLQTTDPLGNLTRTRYDAPGDPTLTIDPLGIETGNTYDGRGVLIEQAAGINAPEGPRLTDNYPDADANITLTVDPAERATATAYDVMNRPASVTAGYGTPQAARTQYLDDADGNVTQTIDANLHPSWSYYDPMNRVTETIDGDRYPSYTYYDGDGQVTETVDADQTPSFTYYDGDGHVIETINGDKDPSYTYYDAAGHVTETVDGDRNPNASYYDVDGNVTLTVDGDQNYGYRYYDLDERLTMTVDGDRYPSYTYYDGDGHVTESIDGDKLPSYTYYDADGRVTEVIDGDRVPSFTYYNSFGDATLTVDGDRQPSYSYYDGDGNVTLAVGGDRTPTYSYYDAVGAVTETVDGDRNPTKTYHDGDGNVTLTVDGNGNRSYSYYDAEANVTLTVDGDQHATYRSYDGDGNVTQTVDGDGNRTYFYYDGDGNVTETIDATGHAAYTYYDGDGNVTLTLDADRHATSTSYDGDGNVIQTTDGNGNAVYTYYDADGNVTETIDGDRNRNYTYYDGDGRVTLTVDGDGNTTYRYYDSDGRVTESIDGDSNPSYTYYDGDGHVTEIIENGVATYNYYDAVGNATMTVDGDRNPTYTYHDGDGNVTETVDSDGNPSYTYYDGDGHVTLTVDGDGNATYQYYDGDGNVTLTVDGDGHRTSQSYDGDGNLVRTIDGENHPSYSYYDGDANVTLSVDGDGNRTYEYHDGDGNITLSVDGDGNRTYSYYDGDSRVTMTVDGRHYAGYTYYDGDGNVTLTVDSDGHRTAIYYDGDGNTTKTVDGNGHPSYSYYDHDGQVTLTIDGDDNPSYSYYDAGGRVTESVDGNGKATYEYYDAVGNVTEAVDADGKPTYSYYDGNGNISMTVDGDHNPSYSYYDRDSRVTETVDADGKLSYTYYDGDGNVTEAIDGDHNPSYRYYDGDSRVTETVDADGKASYTSYDANGNVTRTMDRDQHAWFSYYDADGNVTRTVDADGKPSYSYYDADGNVTLTVDADGNPTYGYYDGDGNVTETVDARGESSYRYYDGDGQVTETVDARGNPAYMNYDADGRVTGSVDADGHARATLYDGDGRVTESIDANGSTTYQYYDPAGNVTEVIDPDGNATQFGYDAAGNKLSETDPLGHTRTFAYDADGRLTSTTDRDGRRCDLTYDADGRLLTETWYAADGSTVVDTLSYSYDADGNQMAASNANGTYTFTYDGEGRLLTEQEPFGLSLTFSYDADGNRTGVQDSLGGTTTAAYDGNGQLTRLRFAGPGGQALRDDLGYDGDGHLATATRYADLAGTQRVGVTSYGYDAVGNLTSLQASDGNGTSLLNYAYTYDANGWLTAQTRNGVTTSYSYDATGQLTAGGSDAYSYDANGNRTMSGYQTGPGNQLLSDGTWNYTYDAEGNLVGKIAPSTGIIWTYTYDDVNRLVSALESWNTDPTQGVVPQGTGPLQLQVDYHYDVFGNRIEEVVTDYQGGLQDSDAQFAYDGQNAWADLDATNQLQTRRLYLNGVDELMARLSGDGTAAWYLTDRQGSVVGLTNGSGSIQDQISYDAFGSVTAETSPPFGDRYKYTAREWDAQVQLQENRHRYYDPAAGRWTTEDPLGFPAGDTNLFRYAANGPTDGTDPSGEVVLVQDGSTFLQDNLQAAGVSYATVKLPGGRQYIDILNADARDRLLMAAASEEKRSRLGSGWITAVVSAARSDTQDIVIQAKDGSWRPTKLSPDEWRLIQHYDLLQNFERAAWMVGQWKRNHPGSSASEEVTARMALADQASSNPQALDFGHAPLQLGRGANDRVERPVSGIPSMVAAPQAELDRQAREARRMRVDRGIAESDLEVTQAFAAAPGMVAMMQYGTVGKGLEALGPHRLYGALQAAGGVIQVLAGLESGPAAPFAVILGASNIEAGLRALVTGRPTYTVAHVAIFQGLKALGVKEEDAHDLADGLEIGVNLASDWWVAGNLGKTKGAAQLAHAPWGGMPVSAEFDEVGILKRSGERIVLPQGPNPTCGAMCAAMVAEGEGGFVIPENFVVIARQKGWLTETGMLRSDIPNLLGEARIASHEVTGATIQQLAAATAKGKPAIVRFSTADGHFVIVDGVTRRMGQPVVAIRNPQGQKYFQLVTEFEKQWDKSMITIEGMK
jgi:RHS repeat-associated protein